MAAILVIGSIATLTHAARSATERDNSRASVVLGRNAGELGPTSGGKASAWATEANRNDADTPKDPAKRALQSRSVTPCADARRAVRWYKSRARYWVHKMGARGITRSGPDGIHQEGSCPQIHRAVRFWRAKARANRLRYESHLRRFRVLYEKWRCIHEHEGAWDASNPPYHGGLQFDSTFQREYGPEFLRRWGGAENWPVWAQLEAAERAYHGFRGWAARGFGPWPNTRRMCGL